MTDPLKPRAHVHSFITHPNYSKTTENPSGAPSIKYSTQKRPLMLGAVAHFNNVGLPSVREFVTSHSQASTDMSDGLRSATEFPEDVQKNNEAIAAKEQILASKANEKRVSELFIQHFGLGVEGDDLNTSQASSTEELVELKKNMTDKECVDSLMSALEELSSRSELDPKNFSKVAEAAWDFVADIPSCKYRHGFDNSSVSYRYAENDLMSALKDSGFPLNSGISSSNVFYISKDLEGLKDKKESLESRLSYYPGDLSSSGRRHDVIDMKEFSAMVNHHTENRCSPEEKRIINNAVNILSRQLIPGGNPAIASDVQRVLIILMDIDKIKSGEQESSAYTDHDSHDVLHKASVLSHASSTKTEALRGNTFVASGIGREREEEYLKASAQPEIQDSIQAASMRNRKDQKFSSVRSEYSEKKPIYGSQKGISRMMERVKESRLKTHTVTSDIDKFYVQGRPKDAAKLDKTKQVILEQLDKIHNHCVNLHRSSGEEVTPYSVDETRNHDPLSMPRSDGIINTSLADIARSPYGQIPEKFNAVLRTMYHEYTAKLTGRALMDKDTRVREEPYKTTLAPFNTAFEKLYPTARKEDKLSTLTAGDSLHETSWRVPPNGSSARISRAFALKESEGNPRGYTPIPKHDPAEEKRWASAASDTSAISTELLNDKNRGI